jgi:diadenylate cyclase
MKETFKNIANLFTDFKPIYIIDIAVLFVAFFFLFRLFKKRNAKPFIVCLFIAAAAYFGLLLFKDEIPVLFTIVRIGFIPVFIVLITVLFAPEIKRGVVKLSRGFKQSEFFSTRYDVSDEVLKNTIVEIIRAVQNMSKKNVGALIVIAPAHIEGQILESGTTLNAVVSAPLLESIFNTKAPMHDGAVIVRSNLILAAGCFLTLSQNPNLPHDLGTRHRAALGVSEQNDVLSLIVSEQTGIISICRNGIISRYFDSNMLNDVLEQVYGLADSGAKRKKKRKHINEP